MASSPAGDGDPLRRLCPQCHAETAWQGNPHRPFCSERCRMIDLAGWLGERYVIPGQDLDDAEWAAASDASDRSEDPGDD